MSDKPEETPVVEEETVQEQAAAAVEAFDEVAKEDAAGDGGADDGGDDGGDVGPEDDGGDDEEEDFGITEQEDLPEQEEGEERDISGDGGCLKKILKKGAGERPPDRSQVKVHYTGTLQSDDSKFDSSRDRGEPFEFEIGKGAVIKAWDAGVATMRPGERAILTCRSDYAYGDQGSGPKIPGGATLCFDVELLSWSNEEDITDETGGVIKSQLRKGEHWGTPDDDAKVVVTYTGSADGKEFVNEKEKELDCGDVQMPDGLNKAITSMKKGEHSTFKVREDFGYGEKGNKELGIGAHAALVYDIELISFDNGKKTWDMDTKEKIEHMTAKKKRGNGFYKIGKLDKAIEVYGKALDVFSEHDMKDMTDEEKGEITPTQTACNSNIAMCQLKKKDFSGVVETCTKVLENDPKHMKCLFRRGQANAHLTNNSAALKDLNAAAKLAPDDKSIEKWRAVVKKRITKERKKQQKTFAGMFDRVTLAKGDRGGYPEKKVASDSDDSDYSDSDDDEEPKKEEKEEPKPEEQVPEPVAENAVATEAAAVETEAAKETNDDEEKEKAEAEEKEKAEQEEKEKAEAEEKEKAELEAKEKAEQEEKEKAEAAAAAAATEETKRPQIPQKEETEAPAEAEAAAPAEEAPAATETKTEAAPKKAAAKKKKKKAPKKKKGTKSNGKKVGSKKGKAKKKVKKKKKPAAQTAQ